MKVSGVVEFAASAGRAKSAIQRQDHLRYFMPGNSKLDPRDVGSFDFAVEKGFGPVMIRLPGVLTVVPDPHSDAVLFRAIASHTLGGSADLDITLVFSGDATNCKITYEGTLQATGLAGKALALASDKVQTRLLTALEAFGRRLEKSQSKHDARIAERRSARV